MATLPAFSMRQLIEAGAHFGHNTRRWNPKMKPYLFGVRDGVHIIDLQQSVPLLQRAMQQRDGLGEIDDVDVVAGTENVIRHLRIPAVRLVAKVNASFKQLTHRKIG